MTTPTLDDVRAALPADLQAEWDQLLDSTLHSQRLAQVCVVGEFSSGKTSLLNMLIGRPLLPVGLAETTSLPTLLKRGSERQVIEESDGTVRLASLAEAEHAATHATPSLRLLTYELDLPWLDDIMIVDLPGLGSVSPDRQRATHAFIADSDVVLYTLSPRGPTAPDITVLRDIIAMGKGLRILATRWDEAIRSDGAKVDANLKAWEVELHRELGVELHPIVTSYEGLGRSDVLAIFLEVRQELGEIRQHRFDAEASALLRRGVLLYDQELEILRAEGDDQRAEARRHLAGHSAALLALRKELHDSHRANREKAESETSAHRASSARDLSGTLATLRPKPEAIGDDFQVIWEQFLTAGQLEAERRAETTSRWMSDYLRDLGAAGTIPPAQLERIAIDLPPMPEVSAEDFAEEGRRANIQSVVDALEGKVEALPGAESPSEAEVARLRHSIREALQARSSLAAEPLAAVQEVVPSKRTGARVGRFIGEALDLAVLFVPVAGQIPAIAKAIKGTSIAAKTLRGTMKLVSTVHQTRDLLKKTGAGHLQSSASTGRSKTKGSALDWLDYLTLGTICEKVGGLFDAGDELIEYPDPELVRQRDEELQRLDAETRGGQIQLAALEQQLAQGAQTEAARDALRLQIKRQKERLADLERNAQAQLESALQLEQQRWSRRVGALSDSACRLWTLSYDHQSGAMARGLLDCIDAHWTEQVQVRLDQHKDHFSRLEAQLSESDQTRAARLAEVSRHRKTLSQSFPADLQTPGA